jgi:hypothetical protein
VLSPGDELRHRPGDDPLWNESWYFDVVAPDATWGMYARLGLYPNLGTAWWWAVVVREDQPLLLVRDHSLAIPRGASFEVRGDGLWADLTCHEPLERWQVNFEGVAVALDDPSDAYRSEHGDRTPIEFEFEWEAAAPAFRYPGVDRYEQSCVVHGEVQIATAGNALSLEEPVPGQRDHSWGVRDWWSFPWVWTAGVLDDGTRFHASRPEIDGVKYEPGYVVSDGELVGGMQFDVAVISDDDGLPSTTTMCINGLDVIATPRLAGGVAMQAPDGRVGRLHRAASTFITPDGRSGVGWMEWNLPPR